MSVQIKVLVHVERAGVARVPVYISGRPPLNDFACIHNVNSIGIAGHDTQVVSNDNQGDPVRPAKILHQLQYGNS